jgi:hypothetical protein
MNDIRAGMEFIAGMTGGVAMSAVMLSGRAADLPVSLEWLLGLIVFGGPHRSFDGWMLGFGLHLVLAGAIGIAYGRLLDQLGQGAGWRVGATVGAVHGVLAAIVLTLARLPLAPGPPAAMHDAQRIAVLFGVHLVYGGIVGAMYPPVRVGLRLVVNRRTRPSLEPRRATGLASGS